MDMRVDYLLVAKLCLLLNGEDAGHYSKDDQY